MSRTNDDRRIDEHATTAALTYLDGLTPIQLLNTFSRLQGRVAGAEYPMLVPGFEEPDEDGERARALTCPNCDEVISHGEGEHIDLDVIDLAWRTTSADAAHFDSLTLSVWYDGSGDFETLVYVCGHCAEPVRLPDGWTEA